MTYTALFFSSCFFLCPIYNGHMFRDDKNLKDKTPSLSISLKDSFVSISYSKTDKLITALYMVTDIMDKEEPLRNKLRTLGIEIVSDMHLASSSILTKIYEVVSFLSIISVTI